MESERRIMPASWVSINWTDFLSTAAVEPGPGPSPKPRKARNQTVGSVKIDHRPPLPDPLPRFGGEGTLRLVLGPFASGRDTRRPHPPGREAGLSVPEDLAVLGFDGAPVGRHLRPALSTFEENLDAIVDRAAEDLFDLVSKRRVPQRSVVHREPCSLIVRESCGAGGTGGG